MVTEEIIWDHKPWMSGWQQITEVLDEVHTWHVGVWTTDFYYRGEASRVWCGIHVVGDDAIPCPKFWEPIFG